MKILVAIDSSPSSDSVIHQVLSRPWPAHSEICVMTVVDTKAFIPSVPGVESVTRFQVEEAEGLVSRAAAKFSRLGMTASTTISEGYPQAEILEYAKEWKANYLVLGSHGHSRLVRFFLGSTCQTVLRNAPCSVELVRDRRSSTESTIPQPFKVLIATDGSESAIQALDSIKHRPWPKQTQVRVVSVYDPSVPVADPGFLPSDLISRIQTEHRKMAEDLVVAAQRQLAGIEYDVSTHVLEGDAKVRILDEASHWEADLIVLGSHGKRGLVRFLMGSVSEAVALHAPCSVNVIRPG